MSKKWKNWHASKTNKAYDKRVALALEGAGKKKERSGNALKKNGTSRSANNHQRLRGGLGKRFRQPAA